jgi:trimeric autotransporter adhesin
VGTATLTITGIAITGTNAGDFAQTHTCGSSLAAGASCTINVTFKPTAIGSRSAALSVTDNATGSPQHVPLSGTGTT